MQRAAACAADQTFRGKVDPVRVSEIDDLTGRFVHVDRNETGRSPRHAPLRFARSLHQNISLVPVLTTRDGPFERYTLFEEGLGAKSFAVRETYIAK